ncbi:hypothetical protein E2C01_011724 [Portunus trituberculatus]|uniref:Uncharacterized protein n=1 Tax=Portunus trituberculatus TaxID=210409 RepID=A0A5B7DBZ6_PORTR|nr:hypothetical protein [Portunus trituberculatus]
MNVKTRDGTEGFCVSLIILCILFHLLNPCNNETYFYLEI